MASNTLTGTYASFAVSANSYTLTNLGTVGSGGVPVGLTITGTGDTVVNAGTLAGASYAVTASQGLSLTNQSAGTISGGAVGVEIQGGVGTLFNAGSIAGATYGVRFAAGFANLLAIDPTGSISGKVDGGNAIGSAVVSTLELASSSSQGTLTGLGSQFVDFGAITVDTGAQWTISSAILAGETLTNNGTLAAPVLLTGGATLTNASSGLITAASGNAIYAAVFPPGVTITNAGTILDDTGTAINLQPGGIVSNVSGGTIIGVSAVDISAVGSVSNAGLIEATGASGSGVILRGSGTLTNASTGTISAGFYGVVIGTGAGTVNNSGSILSAHLIGVALGAGGTVSNASHGIITGHYDGINVRTGLGMVTNEGRVSADEGVGIGLQGGGTVANLAGATVTGVGSGIALSVVAGNVFNAGSIGATQNPGVLLSAGGTVTNTSTGRISGYGGVAFSGGAGTLINAGSIVASGNHEVTFGAGYANRLIIDPGASFSGLIDGGNAIGGAAVSTLELASGTSGGTLSGLGSVYINFSQTTIDAGAQWTLTGTNNAIAAGATLINAGTLDLTGATLTDSGGLENDGGIILDPSTLTVTNLTGSGVLTIDGGSTLDVQAGISSGETVAFGGSGAYMRLESPGSIAGSVTNFVVGETIDLAGIDPASVSYSGGEVHFGPGGSESFRLALGGPGPLVATASADGAALLVPCFCTNTEIKTPTGHSMVQHLNVGDEVVTHSGPVRRITWIGTGRVLATRGRRNAATPVIVHRGALGHNVPHRDLHVTKGHSLYIDDVLIPVEFLVNHRSITWDDRAQEVTVYHIELDAHDVLVANGAPAESYRDDGNRWLFQNGNTGWDQPPKPAYAPVLTEGPIVDAVWRRLLDRAPPRPGLPMTDDPDLHLMVDGVRLNWARRSDVRFVFELPASHSEIRIVSRAGSPAELGLARDPRVLGIAIRQLRLWQGAQVRVMDASDDALLEGFHTFEADNNFRWTDGDALLPASLFGKLTGKCELELLVDGTVQYPLLQEAS